MEELKDILSKVLQSLSPTKREERTRRVLETLAPLFAEPLHPTLKRAEEVALDDVKEVIGKIIRYPVRHVMFVSVSHPEADLAEPIGCDDHSLGVILERKHISTIDMWSRDGTGHTNAYDAIDRQLKAWIWSHSSTQWSQRCERYCRQIMEGEFVERADMYRWESGPTNSVYHMVLAALVDTFDWMGYHLIGSACASETIFTVYQQLVDMVLTTAIPLREAAGGR